MFGLESVDLLNPINWSHPLNRGRVLWLYGLPQISGGQKWFDLCGKNNGTLTNGPTWKPTEFGDAGVDFSGGTNRYVQAASGVYVGSGEILNIAAWVRLSSLPGGPYATVAATYTSYPSAIQYTLRIHSTGQLRCYLRTSADHETTGGSTLSTGVWYRVGVTINDVAKTVTTYINGVQNNTLTYTGTPATVTDPLTFGDNASGLGFETLAGVLADISVSKGAVYPWSADYEISRRVYPDVLNRRRRSVVYSVATSPPPPPPPASLVYVSDWW